MIKFISKNVKKTLGLITLVGLSGLACAQSFNWSLAGPVYSAGRVRDIVVDKTDASGNTIYAGSTSSGVFKTIDGGVNWAPLDDQALRKNISYMMQGTDNTIYVATGEGFLRPGQMSKAQLGTGLYKLNGSSLVSLGALADSGIVGHTITRIACSPVNAQVIALATNKGIFISHDGASFSPATGIPVTANIKYGMDVKFDGNGILYCSVGNERGVAPTGSGLSFSGTNGKVYKSNDASLTSGFTDITPTSLVLADNNYGRIELAIAPTNNNMIYASCARKSDGGTNGATLYGLFKSADGGVNWTLALQGSSALDPLSDGGTIASGDYSHVLLVNPNDANELFVGGYGFYIYFGGAQASQDVWIPLGSNLLPNTQYYLHENIHDIKVVGSNPTKFYFVTDAGIYRSTDLSAATSQTLPPSFQPFYKGLITGQFNSVSIETFPLGINTGTVNGSEIDPAAGFIGGTGGNGLNYFSGNTSAVAEEVNYLTGEVYNSEYSKILAEAAILSIANGNIYRTSDARSAQPTLMSFNTYTGALSKIAPSIPVNFNVGTTTTGSPFQLWENYGQANGANDPAVFYNDSLRVQYSIIGVATLTAITNFTFSAPRPNPAALVDSVVIRTATVSLPITENANVSTAFSNPQDAWIKLANNYSASANTITIPPITSSLGPISAVGVTLNAISGLDDISVTFSAPPFAQYTIPFYANAGGTITVPDAAAYYRVFATVFYKYKTGDVVSVIDNNISTKTYSYTTALTQPLQWGYGSSLTSYTMSNTGTTNTLAIINPTYVLTTHGAINSLSVTQSTPVFTVQPITNTSHTLVAYGDYEVAAKTVTYVLVVPSFTTTGAGATYSFVLMPDNVTQTVATSSSTNAVTVTPPVFVVTPTIITTYTITQTSSTSTVAVDTYSTIDTPTYVLNPGNVVQSDPDFTVTIPVGGPNVTYTLTGLSSPSQFSTSVTYALPIRTYSILGGGTAVPRSQNNPYIKIPTIESAKFAIAFNAVTGSGAVVNGPSAVVVSKAPLSLNDPFNFIRLSQSGCLKTNNDGSPSYTATINIDGDPTVIQWSNSGTELYYATSNKKLYRVSYINLIMDYAPASYSGKINTDLFNYANTSSGGGVGGSAAGFNPNCPYRTTQINGPQAGGAFPNNITSINISRNDNAMLLTFDENPTSTSPNLVMYTDSLKAKLTSNIVFTQKTTPQLKTLENNNLKVYCALIEHHDSSKVFIGTDNGIFYTSNIKSASPTWVNANNNQLPLVQVYDIKQQTMGAGECYNSGEIYVATYGRGVWTNSDYRTANDISYVGIKEQQLKEKNISIFPNPTNGNVTVSFNGESGETAVINILDLSGRVVKSENLGKLSGGEIDHQIETSSLSQGIYLVNVASSGGTKRTAKLIVSK